MTSGDRDLLRARSLRTTGARLKIMEALRSAARPMSAREIHAGLGGSAVDLATVYRTLERFAAASLVRRVQLGDGVCRYETAQQSHHHHLICTTCGAVASLSSCQLAGLEDLALRRHGFRVASHSLEFFGTCQQCLPRHA